MRDKSQAKRIVLTAGQLGLLLLLFVVLGFIMPIYIAPSVAKLFGVTTPYQSARQQMSVQLSHRNVNNGERFRVAVSNPAADITIKSLSYDCEYPEIRLAYAGGESQKEIPCGTELSLPERNQHEIMVLTRKPSVTYVPVNLRLTNGAQEGQLSVVVAAASSDVQEQSTLADMTTATLSSFPGKKTRQ